MAVPKKPKGKPPSKPKGGSKFDEVVESRRLGRNVHTRNIEDVQASGRDILETLRDPNRAAEAAELLRAVAQEADPTKPGYEGNEIVLPFAQALMQLTDGRRRALIEAAGNPPVFADLAQIKTGELDDVPSAAVDEAAAAADSGDDVLDFLNQTEQAVAGDNQAIQSAAQQALDLSRSASTFAGTEFADANVADPRAPIDRSVPTTVIDKTTRRRRPATAEEQDAAREAIIREIIGVDAWNQYKAITGKGRTPVLPPVERPTLKDVEARRAAAQNADFAIEGASPQASRILEDRLADVESLPVDPGMEQYGHLLDRSLALTADELNALPTAQRMAYLRGELRTLDDLVASAPQDIVDSSSPMLGQAQMPEPLAGGLVDKDSVTAARAEALAGRSTPYASVVEQIQHRMAMEEPRFSAEGPSALPSQEMKDNIVARLRDQLAEMERRRAVHSLNPTDAPAGELKKISPMTVGTLGIQAPYRPGRGSMTVDQQLAKSVRPESARLIEKLYMAARQYGGDVTAADASGASGAADMMSSAMDSAELGTDAVKRDVGGGGRNPIVINLDEDFPEWRYQIGIPNDAGGFDVSPHSLSGRGLARWIAAWHGVVDADDFEAAVGPVLEDAIRRQHGTLPTTPRATKAAETLLIPNMKQGGRGQPGKGAMFFNSPFGRAYVEQSMFDSKYPMQRLEPKRMSQQPREPREIPSGVLGKLLDKPVDGGALNLDDVLDAPVSDISQAGEVDLESVLDSPAVDDAPLPPGNRMPSLDELDSILQQPVEGDIDLSMNKARRTPLAGLLV